MRESNRKQGARFEKELAEMLSQHGYWVHCLQQNSAGQPADLIAVKNCVAYLIDCKVCTDGTFKLSRIEENQKLAMSHFRECNNTVGLFAMKLGDDVLILSLDTLLQFEKSVLTEQEIRSYGIPLEEWTEYVDYSI